LRISYTGREWGSHERVQGVVSRDLVELGQETVEELARECAGGARALQLQLLASPFYEALKREMRTTDIAEGDKLRTLAGAANQCRRAANCSTTPAGVVIQLRAAVAMLSGEPPPASPPATSGRPQLRVIQGGRA
jgi:hypothetical protein